MSSFKTLITGVSAFLIICTSSTTTIAQSKILRVASTNPASSSSILFTVLGKIYPREIGVSLQINTGQTITRSVLKFGTDDLEMMQMVPQIVPWLKNGKKMYKKKLQK